MKHFLYLMALFSGMFLTSCSTVDVLEKQTIIPKDAVLSANGKIFRTGLKIPLGFKPANIIKADLGEDLPATFDWRTKVQLAPIENQGNCGACWSFCTTATFQDVKRIFGETEDLSEQYLLSCANPTEWSCNGGFFGHDAHKSPRGAVLASEYPYTGTDSACKSGLNYRWKLTSWAYLPGGETPTVNDIKAAIYKYGPISIGVAADSSFSNYSGGIFQGSGSTSLNHAVNLVGWGTDHWILRNSWGSGWGENGFMRIKFGANKVGAWANFIVYNTEPTPGPGPGPDPEPPPPPPCDPQPYADTGYGDAIKVRVGGQVYLGTKARPGHYYYWTADPAFDNNALPKDAKIKYSPRITKRLTVHAVTQCGEATDSVTVNAMSGYKTEMSPEVD
jgi:Pyruvate/2-oxoacid:ferredoxin oxidoreductase delta subunit